MWILTGSGALALVALGLAMARFDEFRVAYWLFMAAGIVATFGGLWYGFTTNDSPPLRLTGELVTGIGVFVLLPMLFRWLKRRIMKAEPISRTTSSEPSSVS